MKPKLISTIKYLLFFALGLGLLYLAFRNTNISQMIKDIRNANYFWVILSLLVAMIAYISRAIRWNMLIQPLGYNARFKNTFSSLMVGYIANLAVPRIGEISRCEALSRSEKIPFNMLIGTVITERIIDLIMLCLMLTLTAILKIDVLGKFIVQKILHPLKDAIYIKLHSPVFLTILIASVTGLIVLSIFLWKRKNVSFVAKLKNLLKGIAEGIQSIKKIKSIPWFIFHTLLIWFIYFLTTYLCFFSISATSGLGVVAGIFVLSIGGIGMSAPVQGGIGAYHLMVSMGLTLFNIELKDGNTFATIVHTSQTLLVLIVGALSILFLFFSNKQNDSTSTNTI